MKRIFLQYNIKKHNVVAHSDIAPKRKLDPGELFDWETLAKKKLAYWPKIKKYKKNKSIYQLGQEHDDILKIKNMLFKIGYDCNNTKLYDLVFKLTIEAFQRRFFPEKVNGIIDTNLYNRIVQIYKNS